LHTTQRRRTAAYFLTRTQNSTFLLHILLLPLRILLFLHCCTTERGRRLTSRCLTPPLSLPPGASHLTSSSVHHSLSALLPRSVNISGRKAGRRRKEEKRIRKREKEEGRRSASSPLSPSLHSEASSHVALLMPLLCNGVSLLFLCLTHTVSLLFPHYASLSSALMWWRLEGRRWRRKEEKKEGKERQWQRGSCSLLNSAILSPQHLSWVHCCYCLPFLFLPPEGR